MSTPDLGDEDFRREVAFLQALVRVPSDNPPGDCAPHAEAAASLLQGLGFTVERDCVPANVARAHGMISATNLIVRERFGAGQGPVVALNAHGDVVAPGEGWSVDPYGAVVKDGALYGRGAAVSKSDFATYAFALLALKAQPAGLNGTVELHLTYDEEVGGVLGPKRLLDESLTKPDFAISAGFSYAIITAHAGCLHLEVTVRGRQAHAAMPESGADALEAATAVLQALYDERRRIAHPSAVTGVGAPKLTVGLISGGINTNVVPDRIVMRLDRRLTLEEQGEMVERGLRTLIEDAVQGRPGISVDCRRVMLAEPLKPVPGVEALAGALKVNAEREFNTPIEVKGVPLYTDARHYSEKGIPTVLYGAGPRSIRAANAHAADEHVQLSDLQTATRVIAATLRDLLKA